MKKISVLLSFILCLFTQSASAQNISPQTFWKMKKEQDPIIIDVRTKDEFEQGYIKGAINIPVQQIESITEVVTDKDAVIILYCRSGHRASVALKIMNNMGYTKVYNAGGLNDLLRVQP